LVRRRFRRKKARRSASDFVRRPREVARFGLCELEFVSLTCSGRLAVRTSPFHGEGRGFESRPEYHLFLNLKSPSHRTGFERTHRWNCLGAVSVARSHDQQGPFGKAEEGKVCCRGRSPSRRIWSGDGRSGTAVASLGPHSYECVHFGVPPIFEPKSPRLTERKLNSVEESKPPAEALDRRASRRKLGH
jgi:hypothetical protein